MNRSTECGELFAALAAAQAEYKPVVKNKKANYGMFADLGAIIEATSAALSKHGLCVTQNGNYIDGRVTTITVLGHKSGQWIETTISLKPKQDSEQSVGSAITYGRRYSLAPILGVAAEVDDDAGHAVPLKHEDKQKDSVSYVEGYLPPGVKVGPPDEFTPMRNDLKVVPEIFSTDNDEHVLNLVKVLKGKGIPDQFHDEICVAMSGKGIIMGEIKKAIEAVVK